MLVKIDGVKISGVASALPRNIRKVDSFADKFGEKQIKRLKKSTGVESMHYVSNGQTASDLCYEAAKQLVSELEIDAETIDGIVFASFSPDYKGPPTSVVLQYRLGLPHSCVAFDITYGCSAYCYGLYQACMLVATGGCKRVLVCTGDTQTKMINSDDRAMQVIVGDAGNATLVEKGKDSISFYFKTVGSGYKDLIIPAGGYRNPITEETSKVSVDENGNYRSQNDLYMDGMNVMNFALSEVPLAVNSLLDYSNITKDGIDLFAMHQPNKLILDHLAMDLDIPFEKVPVGLQKTGNTASASIPLLLSVLKKRGLDFSKEKKVFACGFGMGLSVSAGILDLSQSRIIEPIIV